MVKVHVKLKKELNHSYDIIIEEGLLKKIPTLLKKKKWGKKYAIISDKTVGEIYGRKLQAALKKSGINSSVIIFEDGDKNKNIKNTVKIMDELLNNNFDRNDAILALGGGVAGDLAGFVSSIFLRGIPYVHIPTSLLAMTDSSIGGKTGINLKEGKNLAGTFYQPQAVLIDPTLLRTLPEKQMLNGMSEVLKYGIITDPTLFNYIEKNVKKLTKKDPTFLNKIIIQSCKIKARIVEKDEHEKTGLRITLNYGHTIGHALEKLSSYKIDHGEAIAIGMKLINLICTKNKILHASDSDRINNLINNLGLIQGKYKSLINEKSANKIWKVMNNDKKVVNRIIKFIVPTRIGAVKIYDKISKNDLVSALKNYDRN